MPCGHGPARTPVAPREPFAVGVLQVAQADRDAVALEEIDRGPDHQRARVRVGVPGVELGPVRHALAGVRVEQHDRRVGCQRSPMSVRSTMPDRFTSRCGACTRIGEPGLNPSLRFQSVGSSVTPLTFFGIASRRKFKRRPVGEFASNLVLKLFGNGMLHWRCRSDRTTECRGAVRRLALGRNRRRTRRDGRPCDQQCRDRETRHRSAHRTLLVVTRHARLPP